RGLAEQTLLDSLQPASDVVMRVESTDKGVIDQVLDSLRRVPAGSVAIPVTFGTSKDRLAALENAGVHVEEKAVYRPELASGTLLSTDPPVMSVVEKGSTVTVSVSTSSTQDEKTQQIVERVRSLVTQGYDPAATGTLTSIALGLGGDVIRSEPVTDLGAPSNWIIHRQFFNGYIGPFSARDYLATDPATWRVTEEGQYGCPWGRADDLPGFESDRRLTIEPTGTDCTQWWAVDVYVNKRGSIGAISLNLVEP
ncbi:MAG: PASTA domain-containing protein, partial [Nocardioidaceae bacterium]